MELTFEHKIKYTTHEPVSLIDVANALLANDSIIRLLPSIIHNIDPSVSIEYVKIELDKAEKGSLSGDFLVTFIASQIPQLQGFVEQGVEAATGMEILPQYQQWVTALVILIVLYGSKLIYGRFRSEEKTPAAINGDYNRVLTITAEHLHITPDALEHAIGEAVAVQPKKTFSTAVGRFIRPAKRNGASPIEGFGEEMISRGAVEEFPAEAELAEDDNVPSLPLTNVRVEILALDRQKRGTGWAARFPDKEVEASRITMDLYPTIPLDALATAIIVRADVLVEFKMGTGGPKPSRIHMLALHDILH